MKTISFILIGLIFSMHGYSQLIFSAPSITSADEVTTIDSTLIRISYAFNPENIIDINTYDDLQRLEIGSSLSKYYSWFLSNSDSLLTQHLKKSPKVGGIPRHIGPCGKKCDIWSEYRYSEFIKDFTSGTLTEYARMPLYMQKFNSAGTERLPVQQWDIKRTHLLWPDICAKKPHATFVAAHSPHGSLWKFQYPMALGNSEDCRA